jgi:GTP-binding protein HflX
VAEKLKGNTKGLSLSQIKRVEKLFNRKIQQDEVVSPEFARELYEAAESLGRRIGVLITREGEIAEVILGTKNIIYLPDLGRSRLGGARLRRLRFVFSDLSINAKQVIPSDVYIDLEKLRLDLVAGVKVEKGKVRLAYAYNVPERGADNRAVKTEVIENLAAGTLNFSEFIENLEGEFSRKSLHVAQGKDRAVLVGVYPKNAKNVEDSMNELQELAKTAGVQVIDKIFQRRDPDPRTLLGKGKLEEVVLHCLRCDAEIIIFDTELTPSQWRVITNSTDLRVLDRSMLILDIFSQRARSSDGRLQVELAQLKYNLPRLVEKDAGLSRLTGGIGGRGPGETKLEIGRRRSREKIRDIELQIEKFAKQRALKRQQRNIKEIPLVALLGYTNVGKSTLFNALTDSSVLAESKLFATLDLSQRRLFLPAVAEDVDGEGKAIFEDRGRTVILVDTVGFIRDLPEELTVAFKATLEEAEGAALLLHVLDASDPEIALRKQAVDKIISDMNLADTPQLIVLNKTDRISEEEATLLEKEYGAVAVSALSKKGLPLLLGKLGSCLK